MSVMPDVIKTEVADHIRMAEVSLLKALDSGERTDSLAVEIATVLAREIIEGRLQPGDDLNSVGIATRFSTSRTPAREAIAVLERTGLVEMAARRRPRVAVFESAQIQSIYVLRAELHAMVARRVALVATPQELTQLTSFLDAMRGAVETNDVNQYFWLSFEFQSVSGDITRDTVLTKTVNSLGFSVLPLRLRSLSRPGRLQLSYEDHVRLIRAYRERDAEMAGAITKSIVVSALAGLLEHQ